jgi:hypothetical protein
LVPLQQRQQVLLLLLLVVVVMHSMRPEEKCNSSRVWMVHLC